MTKLQLMMTALALIDEQEGDRDTSRRPPSSPSRPRQQGDQSRAERRRDARRLAKARRP